MSPMTHHHDSDSNKNMLGMQSGTIIGSAMAPPYNLLASYMTLPWHKLDDQQISFSSHATYAVAS